MNVKTVSVHYERKANLGDFNSAAIGCTLWVDVEEGEDLLLVMGGLWNMAKANVKAQLMPLVTKQTAQVKDIFLGLPVAVRTELTGGEDAPAADAPIEED